MDGILSDLKQAVRTLIKNPGFAAIAVLTLALGIGANTAMFSLTDQVLLRNLPVERPEELVVLRSPGPTRGRLWSDGDSAQSFSYPMYRDLRDRNEVFTGLLARFNAPVSVSGEGQTERAQAELVSGNYFEVLGVRPALGRTLMQEDDVHVGGHPVIVLSHAYWTRRFGGDPGVLNKTLLVNSMPMTVVGVAHPNFNGIQLGVMPDLFVPMAMKKTITPNWTPGTDELQNYRDYWAALIGRLKPGLTPAQAEEAIRPTYRAILEEVLPKLGTFSGEVRDRVLDKRILLMPGSQGRTVVQRDAGPALLVLMGMVGLVLLIACGNVANLLMARGAARQREIGIRLALGASRARLVRQFLVESLVLSVLGGVFGLLVAAWTTRVLISSIPSGVGVTGLKSDIDLRILGFNLALSLVTGILFGLLPAFRSTRLNIESTLREQGSSVSGSRSQVRFRKGLVAAQIVLTAVLLVAAGLFSRSLSNLNNVALGVRVDHMIEFSLAPSLNGYSVEQAKVLFANLLEGIKATSGVDSVSAAELGLFTDSTSSSNITVEGYTAAEGEDTNVNTNAVGPDFCSTMGIPLIRGRDLNASDTASNRPVAVINEAMAERFFQNRDALGQHFMFGADNTKKPDIEIVGIVRNSKSASVRSTDQPFAYVPFAQNQTLGSLTVYTRTRLEPSTMAATLRAEVQKHDGNLPVYEMKTFEARLDESLYQDRLMSMLAACFGLLAALLAAIGLYGVMAFTVARRTREIGIRMALGATQGNVAGLILREVGVLVGAGLLVGLPAAFGLGRLAESLLFGVKASDPIVFLAVSLMLVVVAFVGGSMPARRATRVDPIKALRYE
jgi:predicted permease